MSETKWTPAQRAAIDDRGGALLVSAAAGSGKTAVLTERAVRLITDPEHPVDADRLLIVTFTNAAAAELRARIGQALLRRSQAEPSNTALRRQRMLLQRAPICTIDAFCLDLLRKHFQALDIPPDFTPADPGSVEMLRNAALSETLEAAYQDADFCAFADLYGKGRTDKAAGEAVLQVYDFLRALPDYDKKLDEMLAPWQEENGFARTCWHDILMQEAARSARAAKELLCAALNDCKEDFVTAQADAEASKKTSAAKEKAVAAVNEKFAEPLERLENSAALLGETEDSAEDVLELACNLDDMTPEAIGFALERLLEAGALDAWTTPIGMKKSRPGVLLRALCLPEKRQAVLDVFLRDTTTLGVREHRCSRTALQRSVSETDSPWGPVRCKQAGGYGVSRKKYEFDDLARIARETGLSLPELLEKLP